MSSLLIQNGMIYDDTGAEGFRADLLVRDDRIAAIGEISSEAAEQVINAEGRVVCPGFIDIHRHCDAKFLLNSGFGTVELAQGITTCVVGNCGMSLTPPHLIHSRTKKCISLWNQFWVHAAEVSG
jgi:N-acyl-D-amino-acid deacylase